RGQAKLLERRGGGHANGCRVPRSGRNPLEPVDVSGAAARLAHLVLWEGDASVGRGDEVVDDRRLTARRDGEGDVPGGPLLVRRHDPTRGLEPALEEAENSRVAERVGGSSRADAPDVLRRRTAILVGAVQERCLRRRV